MYLCCGALSRRPSAAPLGSMKSLLMETQHEYQTRAVQMESDRRAAPAVELPRHARIAMKHVLEAVSSFDV